MDSDVRKNMRDSIARVDKARPIVASLMGGELRTVEGDDHEICRLLDTLCGTDWLQVYEKRKLVQGVATRTQTIRNGYKPYNSFTIRKEIESGNATEYQKRLYAIEHGGVFPYLTIQIYASESEELLSVGIARTSDIMDYINKGYAAENKTGNGLLRPATFYVCKWDNMKDKGYQVRIWQANDSY